MISKMMMAAPPAKGEVKLYGKIIPAPERSWWNDERTDKNPRMLLVEKWYGMHKVGMSPAMVLFFLTDQVIDLLFAGYVFHFH